MTEPSPNTLIVDDEKEVADAYALRLRDFGTVETVYDGRSALERIDDGEIDIVLLDRHMPGMAGDEVLSRLDERDFVGQVVMVTAIDPGFEVLDMPFDDYLCKPVNREDIRQVVSQQATILGYATLGEYFAVESTRQVIVAELPPAEREANERYQSVTTRANRLRARAERLLPDADDLLAAFDDIGREGR